MTVAHDEVIDSDPFGLQQLADDGGWPGGLKVLRQSTLGQADTCLRRLHYGLAPDAPYRTGEARAVGTAYHAGLAAYYDGRKASEEFHLEDVTEIALWAFEAELVKDPDFKWDDEFEGKKKADNKVRAMLKAYFDQGCYWPGDYEVIGVEHTFLMPLSDGWIAKGTIDLIVEQPGTGFHIVVDHKTAQRPWAKNRESHRKVNQPSWYTKYWRDLSGRDVAFCYDIMSYGGKFERRPVTVLAEHEAGVFGKAKLVTELLDAGGPFPPNTDSKLCSEEYCDYWQVCEFGERFGV